MRQSQIQWQAQNKLAARSYLSVGRLDHCAFASGGMSVQFHGAALLLFLGLGINQLQMGRGDTD
jgi:hypothetical protein